MKRLFTIGYCSALLMLLFVQTLYAQQRKEQAFFIDSGSDSIFYLDRLTSPPVSKLTFATPISMGFLGAIDYDPVYRRLVYTADMMSPGSPELGVLYTEDVAVGNPDITVLLIGTPLGFSPPTILSVNGATDEIYFVQGSVSPSPSDRQIYKTDFKGTTPSMTPYFDGSSETDFTEINAVSADTRRANAVFFATDDNTGAMEPSRLYYFDGTTLTYVSSGVTVNAADQMRFDPVTERLYTLDVSAQTTLVYDVAANGTLTPLVPNQITYGWSGADIGSFDFLYDSLNGDLSQLVLGDVNTEDVILDDTNIEFNTDAGRPSAISFDNSFITRLRATSLCSDAIFDGNGDLIAADFDGDDIPDCRDQCPIDATNACMYLIFAQETSDMFGINQFIRHEVDTMNGQFLGTLFPNISLGGFYDEQILEFVYDQDRHTVYYTSSATPINNSLFAIDLETNIRSVVAAFNGPTDPNVRITSLSLDSEEPSLYILIEDMNSLKCFVKKVNPAGGNATLDMVPTIFERDCTGSEIVSDIVIDQRRDAKNDSYNKRLYYSYSNLGTSSTGVFEVDLMDNTSDLMTHIDITDGEFDGFSHRIGQLALDFNNDNLYYYIEQFQGGTDGIIRFSQLPGVVGSTAPSSLFVGVASPSTGELQGLIEEVQLYYHPHIVSGGRLYVSDATFASGDAVKFKDMQNGTDTGCTSTCLVDSDTLLAADVDEIKGLDFYLTCNLGSGCTVNAQPEGCANARSVDSNGDGFPDCSGIDDLCLNDDGLTTDADSDGDGTADCSDNCPSNAIKVDPGICGCSRVDDADMNGFADCAPEDMDLCPSNPNRFFPGACGCDGRPGDTQDSDQDGIPDCTDVCPDDPNPTDSNGNPTNIFPICGCGVPVDVSDPDGDGTPACLEDCTDSTDEGCGCGISDCSGIDGVRLTPTTRIKTPPIVNNNRSGNRKPRKRRFRLNLKKFSGAVTSTSSQSQFSLAERRRKRPKVRYRVTISKLIGNKIRRVKRIVTRKALTRLIRLKNGKYTVKYKAQVKRNKKTVSQTNFSPSRSFNIPFG